MTSPDSIPIARVFAPQELHGWLKKSIIIPAGKTGVVIYHDGKQRLMPAGKHLLLNPFTRLRGDGIGMLAGYVPASPFKLGARFENLLSGDDELLDATIVTEPTVKDPAAFFTRLVVPAGELTELPADGIRVLQHALEKFVSQYERDDLLHKVPADRINSDLYSSLRQLFPEFGLELNSLPQVFLKRTEDRLLVEDKLAEIENRVQQPSAVQNPLPQAADVTETGEDDSPRLITNEKKPLSEILEDIRLFRNLEKAPRPHWIFRSLQSPNLEGVSDKERTGIRKYRALEFRWLLLFLTIGAGITYILFNSKLDLNKPELIGFTTGVWASIFSLIITRLKKIVEKQERLTLQSMGMASRGTPNFISLEDKQAVDTMVRQQCARELRHTREMLNETRERVFAAGNHDLALRIKDFEKSIEGKSEWVSDSDAVAPHYLSDTPVRSADWNRILDLEEDLLLQSKSLGKMAEKLRTLSPEIKPEDLDKLIQAARQLEDKLFARSRIV